MAGIRENVVEIRERIAAAAKKSGRSPEDITLVGVTKTIDAERINEVLAAGVKTLGENRVQEFLLKRDGVRQDFNAEWHIIGHLQTNKVKSVLDKVSMIQSVDSIHLVEAINKYSEQMGILTSVLIEINIENEDTKYGIKSEQLDEFLETAYKLSHVSFKGLMAVPPARKTAQNNRKSFEKLKRLFVDTGLKYSHNEWQILSMGMSGDYEEAIEEGASMVRIGTALFGVRE